MAGTVHPKWIGGASATTKRRSMTLVSEEELARVAKLNRRQKELLRDMTQGLTYGEIAARRQTSESAIKSQLLVVYRRLGMERSDGKATRAVCMYTSYVERMESEF